MIKKIFLTRVFIITLAVFLMGGLCFTSGQSEEPETKKSEEVTPVKEKVLLLVTAWGAEGLDPVFVDTSCGACLHGVGAMEYLVRISIEGKVEPELAESFRSIDPNTWEVKLRPNVTFWSGKAVDAKAVKASLERSRKLSPQAEHILSGIRIEVIDNLTLHLITEKPTPFLPYNIATSKYLAIHNADSYGDKPNPFDIKALDTTGFFRVVKFEPREIIELERFDGYWGNRPKIDRIICREITDTQPLLIEALSGNPHIANYIPPEGADLIKKSEDMNLVETKRPAVYSLSLNTKSPILEDVRVRKALGWGIDRQEVIDLGYNGIGRVAPSWYASNAAYPEAKEMGFTKYDPERASELLDGAGWLMDKSGYRKKNGQIFKFNLITYGIHKAGGEVLQSQLKKIGIEVNIQYSKDWGIVAAKRQEGEWDASLECWGSFGMTTLWRHFATEGDLNYSHYDDKIMDQLIDSIVNSFDEGQRHKGILKANERIFETVTLIPVLGPNSLLALNKKVKGYVPPYCHNAEYMVTPALDIKE